MKIIIIATVAILALLLVAECDARKKNKNHQLQGDEEAEVGGKALKEKEKGNKNKNKDKEEEERQKAAAAKAAAEEEEDRQKAAAAEAEEEGKRGGVSGIDEEVNIEEKKKKVAAAMAFGQMNQRIFCFAEFAGFCIGSGKSIEKTLPLKMHNITNVVALDQEIAAAKQLKAFHYETLPLSSGEEHTLACDVIQFAALVKSGKLATTTGDTLIYHSWNLQYAKEVVIGQQLLSDADLELSDIIQPLFKIKKSMQAAPTTKDALQWSEELKVIDTDRNGKWIAKCAFSPVEKKV